MDKAKALEIITAFYNKLRELRNSPFTAIELEQMKIAIVTLQEKPKEVKTEPKK